MRDSPQNTYNAVPEFQWEREGEGGREPRECEMTIFWVLGNWQLLCDHNLWLFWQFPAFFLASFWQKTTLVHLTTVTEKVVTLDLVPWLMIIIIYNGNSGLHYRCKLRTTWITYCLKDWSRNGKTWVFILLRSGWVNLGQIYIYIYIWGSRRHGRIIKQRKYHGKTRPCMKCAIDRKLSGRHCLERTGLKESIEALIAAAQE